MDYTTHTCTKTEKAAADSRDGVCNDLIKKRKKEYDQAVYSDMYAGRKMRTFKRGFSPDSGMMKIAAGAAGLFLAAGLTPLSLVSGQIAENRLTVPEEQDILIPSLDLEPGNREADPAEEEEELLLRWGLDPQDFPDQEEEPQAEIPDDLLPYFQEMTADAVYSYGGALPPEADMSRYSLRSNAIRQAVRKKADAFCQASASYVLYHIGSLFRKTANEAGPVCLAALQGSEKKDELPVVSWKLPGIKKQEKESFKPGFPLRPAEDPARADGQTLSLSKKEAAQISDAEIYGPFLPAQAYEADSAAADQYSPELLSISDQSGRPVEEISQTQTLSAAGPFAADQPQIQTGDELFPGLAWFPESSDTLPASPASTLLQSDLQTGSYRDRILPLKDPSSARQSTRTVFIGDSRTVGMQMYVDSLENEFWSAKNSMGYSWMVNSGVPAVDGLIGRNTDVVILMGVNDLGNVASYVDYMNEKAAEWKERGARTFFVSVTPVIDSKSPNAKNSRIESFNAYAQENLKNVIYIDAYNRIRYSFGSPDGIHFDGATYQEIYRIIHFYQYTGWYEEAGLHFYFDKGKPLTGWHYLDGEWQYMDGAGVRWIRKGRVGDVVLEGFPETGLLNPYRAVLPDSMFR